VVNDAEESSGLALRVSGEPGSRVRYDLGFSRSRFDNPEDPLLQQGFDLVAVDQVDRDAYFADLDVTLLRTSPADGWSHELSLSVNHDSVDPLYRSTGAYAQADLESTRATLNGVSGPISYTAGHRRAEDNLANIVSILKTKTRSDTFNLALPLSQIWSKGSRSYLLPVVSFSGDRTRQFGAGLPVGGGFSDSHVPDQINVSQVGRLEWQNNRWRFAYELSLSDQDNRQPGRETNDFEQFNQRWRLDLTPQSKLDLGFEYSRERAESIAESTVDFVRRPSVDLSWRLTDRLRWSGTHALTEISGPFRSGESRVTTLEASYRLAFRDGKPHGMGGQLFARFNDEDTLENDSRFGLSFERRDWSIQVGLNLSLR